MKDFEIKGDDVIKNTPIPVAVAGEGVYKYEVVMTKEIFKECYKKWIKQEKNELCLNTKADRYLRYGNDSFSAELDNTEHMYFKTPSGKRVNFIKADILDKIRAEIIQVADDEKVHDEKWASGLRYAVKIIDLYRAESEENEDV